VNLRAFASVSSSGIPCTLPVLTEHIGNLCVGKLKRNKKAALRALAGKVVICFEGRVRNDDWVVGRDEHKRFRTMQ
jgi:hypothetical protein